MIVTLESSFVFAMLNVDDENHQRARIVIETETGPFVVPVAMLAELAYMIESRLGSIALDPFLEDLQFHQFFPDYFEGDIARIREIIIRYADLPLGFSDAAVIACAERNGGFVATFDRRHFDIVAREGTIDILPAFE